MSMKESVTSSGKQPLKQSQLIQRLNEPLSSTSIKFFSNPGSFSTVGTKTHLFKLKKYESLQTNSTQCGGLLNEEIKFVNRYKSDLIFRKKVDILIKQHEKRMKQKQQNYPISQPGKSLSSNTWRIQQQSQSKDMVQLYQKCKKWILKAHEPK